MHVNDISHSVIGAAIEVHRTLGPGLLESVYHQCLLKELDIQGFGYVSEAPVKAHYKGLDIETAYRIDVLIEGSVIVELKVVDRLLPVHEAQLLSYLRLTGKRLGLLLNFNVPVLKDGVKRIVNNL